MTYVYVCRKCGEKFEIKASLEEKEKNDPSIFICPTCKSADIEQKITEVGCSSGSCSGCACGF